MEIEQLLKEINFAKMEGLVPVVTQDFKTGNVLMVGFMTDEALKKTLREGRVTYYSRSKKGLWTKGETSGNVQLIKEIWLDCDNDSVLVKVEQVGNVCHTGNETCFYKKIYEKNEE